MRRIAILLLFLCLASSPGCQVVRDWLFGGLAELGDTSRPKAERRAAYDSYMQEHVDK